MFPVCGVLVDGEFNVLVSEGYNQKFTPNASSSQQLVLKSKGPLQFHFSLLLPI